MAQAHVKRRPNQALSSSVLSQDSSKCLLCFALGPFLLCSLFFFSSDSFVIIWLLVPVQVIHWKMTCNVFIGTLRLIHSLKSRCNTSFLMFLHEVIIIWNCRKKKISETRLDNGQEHSVLAEVLNLCYISEVPFPVRFVSFHPKVFF